MKRTLLLDADILAYIVACQTDRPIDWGDGAGLFSYADDARASDECEDWIRGLMSDLSADNAIICMSDPRRRYWRHDIFPEYKAGRSQGSAPMCLTAVKDTLRNGFEGIKSKTISTLEADDVLGILATHPTLVKGEKVIVTSDKDLKQIPGLYFNIRKPCDGLVEINPHDALRFFYVQALSGDPTDGLPGAWKIGPVKAERIVDSVFFDLGRPDLSGEFMWPVIRDTYLAAGHDEAYALGQVQCIRILQASDYDFKNRKAIPWTPPITQKSKTPASVRSSPPARAGTRRTASPATT
jgi:DNA polymerase I